jgi:hypothetical protein
MVAHLDAMPDLGHACTLQDEIELDLLLLCGQDGEEVLRRPLEALL